MLGWAWLYEYIYIFIIQINEFIVNIENKYGGQQF